MATKSKDTNKFKFKGFVNLEFTSSERNDFVAWLTNTKPDLDDCIVVIVESGYKLGFSYDDYHGVNQVSLTCKDLGSPYAGYCFTFKHASPARGAFVCRWLYDTHLKDETYPIPDMKNKYEW